MDRYHISKLRALPIEGVAERLGLHVVRRRALCPFHQDHHPSLTFSVRRNTFRCFVCGASGGPIDLVMQHLQVGFVEACRWLASEVCPAPLPVAPAVPPEVPFDPGRYVPLLRHPLLVEEARRFLFEQRRLDARVVHRCRLTSWHDARGVPWLSIPYFDVQHRLIGLQQRNLVHGAEPRFRFPRGARCSIYGLPVLAGLQPGEPLFITEGASDCWAMLSAGHKAIAIPSATLLKPADMAPVQEHIARLDITCHMFPDNDAPGERLYQNLRHFLPNLVHHSLPAGCKDFSEWYLQQISAGKFGGVEKKL